MTGPPWYLIGDENPPRERPPCGPPAWGGITGWWLIPGGPWAWTPGPATMTPRATTVASSGAPRRNRSRRDMAAKPPQHAARQPIRQALPSAPPYRKRVPAQRVIFLPERGLSDNRCESLGAPGSSAL